MRLDRFNLVSCLILSSFLLAAVEACWGKTAPDYGEVTNDYDLLEGSDLVLNCTLRARVFPESKEIIRPINSSNLVFEKGDLDFTNFTRRIDDFTIQLKIPNAKLNDSGFYFCRIIASNETKPLVCGSKVSVGHPPKGVSNFDCVSHNYDTLFCSWDVENSNVLTKYTVVKYYLNVPGFEQLCPDSTEQLNSCEWTTETDPKYQPFPGNVSFSVKGNNSLGVSTDKFTLDGLAFVIPNRPEKLKIINVGKQFVTVGWSPPTMRNYLYKLRMQFEVWIGRINSSDIEVFDAGNGTSEFIVHNLIPNISYNISVRCRSVYTKKEKMWSSVASIVVQTLPDVPYKVPEVIPEAYELHLYENSRSVSLYWKIVPELHHNGRNFHYYVKYYKHSFLGKLNMLYINSSNPFVEVKKLSLNASYSFQIYSANDQGISASYSSISVDAQDEILSGPKDIRAIAQDLGHYNLSWNKANHDLNTEYIVFWCPSVKPWMSRCDSPVTWLNQNLTENSIILNLTDTKTNFQFAVVSKTDLGSSGMQWASCIVPHKAALGKIQRVVVEPKNSTALKVIWNLDCPAQKAVVDRYEISYCSRKRKRLDCKVARAEADAEDYLLQSLHPFSNYTVKIRAFNKDNLPSEDSDAVSQITLSGAPAGPPQNVIAYSDSNSSFHVSWTPPLEPNGIITEYIIHYNDSRVDVNALPSGGKYNAEVEGLNPFSTYIIQIQACVAVVPNLQCSVKSAPIAIHTEVGEPGFMDPPRIETVNSTHLKVSWAAPFQPNGPIDFYEIEWHQEDLNETLPLEINSIKVVAAKSVLVDLKCSKVGDGGLKYEFRVRAANVKNGISLLGPFSDPTQATACMMSQGLAMIIGIAIGGTLALAVFILLFYKLIIWMRKKIHQVKSITIRLPKGLEGPETNPLNNYEYFKDNLKKNIEPNSAERHSYIIDENDNKNRHGSGSSQFSNASADEMYKNGKCTKFGRKPSGDSSGCSSMSSNTTPRNHLSSDSGTESDCIIPPSPDSGITELSLHNTHKAPMPILMEVHDQPTSELSSETLPQKQQKNTVDDMILKVDQPYSKFGVSLGCNSASSLPWGMNPLAFYSCNLANSEPSVFNMLTNERQYIAVTPYSKVGLAKSSSDILSVFPKRDIGYSRFGFSDPQHRFTLPTTNLNPIAMLENSELQKQWPNIKKCADYNKTDSKNNIPNYKPQKPKPETGYNKVGIANIHGKRISPGYVPFNEIKSQHDQFVAPITSLDIKEVLNPFSNGKEESQMLDDWSQNTLEGENGNVLNSESPDVEFSDSFFHNELPGESSNYNSFNIPFPEISSPTHQQQPPLEADLKYSINFPLVYHNSENPHVQSPENSMPNYNMFHPQANFSPHADESPPCEPDYNVCNEVVVTPVTLRNGYVPFSKLSDLPCDRTLPLSPNSMKSNAPLTIFSNGVCTDSDNYVTPSNKADLRLLRDDSLLNGCPLTKHNDSFKDIKMPIQNGYSKGSLIYTLKPLPKMESEICEV